MGKEESSFAESRKQDLEATPSSELADEDLEDVAGGAASCTPDQPAILPNDPFFVPLDPTL